MAEKSKNQADNKFDIFVASEIFPNAGKIFSPQTKSLEEIKDEAYIVLDTNALLVPYNIGKESLEKIKETYRLLIEQNRLIIPAQVAREFAKNRANKITELFQKFTRKKNSIKKLQSGKYPLLESLTDYQETTQLEQEIDAKLEDYKAAIDKILDHIRDWRWNDPVSLIYGELFTEDVVYEPETSKEDLLKSFQFRQTHKIPPGYKDASKEDNGVGDYLIWHTILSVGQKRNASVIFVSGEEKPDWWYKSEGQTLYPRYELVDEFGRFSQGNSFHITSFSQFLDLFGASESIVQEVKEEESQLRVEDSIQELSLNKDEIYFKRIRSGWAQIVNLAGSKIQNLPALLNMGKPLEVNGTDLILGFDYPIFRDKYESMADIDEIMSNIISSVINVRGIRVIPVVTSHWKDQ